MMRLTGDCWILQIVSKSCLHFHQVFKLAEKFLKALDSKLGLEVLCLSSLQNDVTVKEQEIVTFYFADFF